MTCGDDHQRVRYRLDPYQNKILNRCDIENETEPKPSDTLYIFIDINLT